MLLASQSLFTNGLLFTLTVGELHGLKGGVLSVHMTNRLLRLISSAVRRHRRLCLAPKQPRRRCQMRKRMGTAKPGASCTTPHTGVSLQLTFGPGSSSATTLSMSSLPVLTTARPQHCSKSTDHRLSCRVWLLRRRASDICQMNSKPVAILWGTLSCCRLSLKQRIETLSSLPETVAEAFYTAISRCDRLTDGLLTLAVAAATVMAEQACHPT